MTKRTDLGLALAIAAVVAGCADQADNAATLQIWRHQVGTDENLANEAMISRFAKAYPEIAIEEQSIPQGSYPQSVMAAAMAGGLPCILTVDAPMVPSFVWAGHIRPLDSLLPSRKFEGIAPAALGRFNGRLYSVGQFDAALALYTRRSALESVNARIPTVEDPWTREEFETVLRDLRDRGGFDVPLDLGTREANPNWWTYAYSPFLQSFGGDLIDRSTMQTAEGAINGPEALAFAAWFRSLFEDGLVRRQEPDDQALLQGRVAIYYSGNWIAPELEEAFGEDLLILPPPDLGKGPVIGGGSWQWAISSDCAQPEAAAAFIAHVVSTAEIAAMSEAAGMVPVTEAAAERTRFFRDGAKWRVFFDLSQAFALERPVTPAFTTLSNTFYRAARDIADGSDPRDTLDDAADDIDRVIADNGGFRLDGERAP